MGTYIAVRRAEQVKAAALALRLETGLIVEIAQHQAALARVLDTVLPAWLRRGESDLWKHRDIIDQIPAFLLSDTYFEIVVQHLVHSPLVVEVSYYYSRTEGLNRISRELASTRPRDSNLAQEYVASCRDHLEVSIIAMDELLKRRHIVRHFSPSASACAQNYRHQRSRYLYLSELAHFGYTDVAIWHQQLAAGTTELIPEVFRNDDTRLWVRYLEAARDL